MPILWNINKSALVEDSTLKILVNFEANFPPWNALNIAKQPGLLYISMTTSTLTPKLNSNDHLNQHKSWHQHHYQQKAALSFDSCYKRFNLTDWKALLLKKRFSGHGGYDGVDGSDDDGWVDSVLLQPIWGWWVPSGVCTPSQVILNVILLAIFHHFEIQVWPTVFCDIQTIQISASYSTLLLWTTQLLSHPCINHYLFFEKLRE